MDLHELAAEGETLIEAYTPEEADVGYVLRELELFVPAFRGGASAIERGDKLAAWMYLRVVCESGIRLGWVAEGWDEAEKIRARLVRLSMVDLAQMLRADDVLRSVMGGRGFLTRAQRSALAGIKTFAAPAPSLEKMATKIGRRGVYAVHRLASAAMHPGLTGGTAQFLDYSEERYGEALVSAFALGCVAAAGLFRALAPETTAPVLPLSIEVIRQLYTES